MFNNLIVDSGLSEVRQNCRIRKDLGNWVDQDTSESFVGERRWFGGYFTTEDGGWFFESEGDACGEKAYTLTFEADSPDMLPVMGDSQLRRIIHEAIDIVDSIHYKRCPPA